MQKKTELIKKLKQILTFTLSPWNDPRSIPLRSRAFFVGPHFQRILMRGALRHLGVLLFLNLPVWEPGWVYLNWAHHCRFPSWRGCLGDQVQPGLPVLGERGGGALWCHGADGGGERAGGFAGDCRWVGGRKCTLENKFTTVRLSYPTSILSLAQLVLDLEMCNQMKNIQTWFVLPGGTGASMESLRVCSEYGGGGISVLSASSWSLASL